MQHWPRSAALGSRLLAQSKPPQLYSRHLTSGQPLIRPQASRVRAFSGAAALDATIGAAQLLFTQVHHVTALPWVATIPVVALSVNVVTRLPLAIYVQRVVQKRTSLTPLLRAWYVRHAKEQQQAKTSARSAISDHFSTSAARIYRQWGVQSWKNYTSFAVLPLWMAVMEALRRLCGTSGWLTTLAYGPKHDAAAAASTTSAPAVFELEPSLSTEGFLWFPDLTAADPLHILPFVLSAVMVLNIAPRPLSRILETLGLKPRGEQASLDPRKTMQQRLQSILLAVAILLGPLTLNLPTALLVYWISSATFTLIQAEIVRKVFKKPDGSRVQPCQGREALLMRPRRR